MFDNMPQWRRCCRPTRSQSSASSLQVTCRTPWSPGLTGWSEKEGDIFVQPPREVLESVTAVRIHIDPCPVESGALRVVPESHLWGVLAPLEAKRLRDRFGEKAVPSPRGGALILKPLLLHASSKAQVALQRRVMHFVFGPRVLPFGLEWQHAI